MDIITTHFTSYTKQVTNYLRHCSSLGIAGRPDFSATPLPVVPCTVTQGEHTAYWAHPTDTHQQGTVHHSINPSIHPYQSINQSTNQPINQSITIAQWLNVSIPIVELIQLTNINSEQPVHPSIHSSMTIHPSIHPSFHPSISQSRLHSDSTWAHHLLKLIQETNIQQ